MKKAIYLSVLLAIIVSCTSKPHYVVNGQIEGSDSVTFYLQKREAGKTISIDSAVSKNGNFTMKGGAVEYPQQVSACCRKYKKKSIFFPREL